MSGDLFLTAEAERAVLGSILLNPLSLFEVNAFLHADDFSIIRHGWAYSAILEIHKRGEAIDNISLADELRTMGRLDEFGGPAYIAKIMIDTPAGIYTETYGRIVERGAIRRRLLNAAGGIAKAAHDETASIDDTLAEADRAYRSGTVRRSLARSPLIRDIGVAHSDTLEERYRLAQDEQLLGVPSGLKSVDEILGGFEKSWYYVLAGRPGMGKTSLLLTILLNAARAGATVGIMTLEMDQQRLFSRLIAMETGITTQAQRQGALDEQQWGLYWEAQDRLSSLPILIDHTPAMSPDALRAIAFRWYHEYGVQLIMIDYVNKMRVPGIGLNDETLRISLSSEAADAVGKELRVPVIMAAQLNRKVEERQDKRPKMSDLKQSGTLEEAADVVMLLYRDQYYNAATERKGQVDIDIAKHRDGPTGTPVAFFRRERTQFVDLVSGTTNLQQMQDAAIGPR